MPNYPKPKAKSGYLYRQYRSAAIRYNPNTFEDSHKTKNTMMPAQHHSD